MSISINNNLHTQRYNPIAKNSKATTDGFALPETQDMPATEVFESNASGKMSDDDFAIFQKQFLFQARVLPQGIGMNDEQLLAFMETKTAKIVFEFGEGGSIRIKEGLSQADYLRAKKSLEEIELWRQGK